MLECLLTQEVDDLQKSQHSAVPLNNMSARDERGEHKHKKRFRLLQFHAFKDWLTLAFELLYFVQTKPFHKDTVFLSLY